MTCGDFKNVAPEPANCMKGWHACRAPSCYQFHSRPKVRGPFCDDVHPGDETCHAAKEPHYYVDPNAPEFPEPSRSPAYANCSIYIPEPKQNLNVGHFIIPVIRILPLKRDSLGAQLTSCKLTSNSTINIFSIQVDEELSATFLSAKKDQNQEVVNLQVEEYQWKIESTGEKSDNIGTFIIQSLSSGQALTLTSDGTASHNFNQLVLKPYVRDYYQKWHIFCGIYNTTAWSVTYE